MLGTAGAGRAHVAWLNALGVQASAIGNHELDLGPAAFGDLISASTAEGDTWTGASFPYLSTNLDFSTEESLSALVAEDGLGAGELNGKLAAYTTFTLGSETIGVVAATTPSLGSITSIGNMIVQPSSATDIDALATLIQADVDALTAKGIDKIIVLAHMQEIRIEKELAAKLSDVDIIVAGGSNTLLADSNDRLRSGDTASDTYPLKLSSKSSEPILVVNTDGDYSYLGRLVVDFDKDGLIIDELLDSEINGVYASDAQGLSENGLSANDVISEMQSIANALSSALQATAGNVVGYTSVYLNGERNSVRTEETNLGNLSADANLAYAQNIDSSTTLSLKNGGGIRGPIGACIVPPGSTSDPVCGPPTGTPGISAPGAISQYDLEIAFRFNNSLSLVTVTGAELKALLENGVSSVENVSGKFPQVAGMTFSYDPSKPAGSRIAEIVVLDSNGAAAGGEAVTVVSGGLVTDTAANQSFRLVTLGFLAEGGDDYPFPTGPEANVVDLLQDGVTTGSFTFASNGSEQDVLAEFLNSNFATAETGYNIADTITDTRITTTTLP